MIAEWIYWSERLDCDLRNGARWELLDIDMCFMLDTMFEAGL